MHNVTTTRRSLTALLLISLIPCLFLTAPPSAASEGPPTLKPVIDPALTKALEGEDRVGARVFFLSSIGPDPQARQSKLDTDVDPVVVDIARTLLPGDLALVEYEWVRAVRGVVNSQVVEQLRLNPRVLSIELDPSVAVRDPNEIDLAAGAASSCVPSATRACVQSGRFAIMVGTTFLPGNFAPVAVSGSASAVFYFFGSSNWEVLAKVLNACSINNRYWVFGAGATDRDFILNIEDTTTGFIVGYGPRCPISDTSTWVC